jgi:TRAP-type transport system periplasmic protein
MSNTRSLLTRRGFNAMMLGAVAAPAVLRHARAAEVVLRLHHMLPPVSTAHRTMFEPWAKKVMAESQGRIAIEIYPSMQLGGAPPELLDQVRDGIVDLVWSLPGYQPGLYPVAETWTLPFMVTNSTQTSKALHEYMGLHGQKEFGDYHVVAFWAQTPGLINTKGKAVTHAADLQGLRLRGANQIITKTLTLLGANGVFFPVTEVPQALSLGIINGVALPYEIFPAYKIHELTDHHAEAAPGARNLYTQPMVLAMNKERYEGMPDDLRKIIDSNSGPDVAAEFGRAFDAGDAFGKSLAQKHGNTFTVIPADEIARWRELVKPLVAEWIEQLNKQGLDGQALVDSANALVDKYATT